MSILNKDLHKVYNFMKFHHHRFLKLFFKNILPSAQVQLGATKELVPIPLFPWHDKQFVELEQVIHLFGHYKQDYPDK